MSGDNPIEEDNIVLCDQDRDYMIYFLEDMLMIYDFENLLYKKLLRIMLQRFVALSKMMQNNRLKNNIVQLYIV